jgi:starch synthase (maltosyl-transferring)
MSASTQWPLGPRIYNLFPLLSGPLPRWKPHLERARRIEFDWLFINPIQLCGFSGSLYSIKDYYTIDPRMTDPRAGAPEDQLRRMISDARELGLRVMMDLVINHTAFDSPLLSAHPAWYKRGAGGQPVNPGTRDGEREVIWGDLIEIDNTADQDGPWRYWIALAEHYAALGI